MPLLAKDQYLAWKAHLAQRDPTDTRAVVRYLAEQPISPPVVSTRPTTRPKFQKYLYLIRIKDTDYFKVGLAANVRQRRDDLQPGCPFPLIIAQYYPISDTYLERRVHIALWNRRIGGEWFNVPYDTLVEIVEQILWATK